MTVTDPRNDDLAPPAPPAPGNARHELATEFLRGRGLEIGALHLRMWLPDGVSVRYVDRMSVEDLRHHYPELAALDLAPVDVIDDGERLDTVGPESVDFIVANHFLEHCQDPISTITTHLSKLRPGGVLFYAVPDKRYTFDFRRDRTALQHVIDDHELGAERSRAEHYLQWASHVHEGTGPPSPAQGQAYADQLEAEDYSIHFHVWTASDLTELMLHIQSRLDSFEIETVRRNGIENIVILRRNGDAEPLAPTFASTMTGVPAPVIPPRSTVGGTHSRIPLPALRGSPVPSDADIHWSIDPDGTTGRGLAQPAGTRYVIPISLSRPVRLEAQVRLLPHDWRDGTRAVRANVRAEASSGDQPLWSASVRSAEAGGQEAGISVRCEVPAGIDALVLEIEPPPIRDPGSAARAVWMEPVIFDPQSVGPAAKDTGTSRSPRARPHGSEHGSPLFSVLTPVHDPPLAMLRDAVESVRAQTFTDWELCLVDDDSCDPEIVEALRDYAKLDSRIHVERRHRAGGISATTNAALALARGEYIGLLDHDDLLVPNALELVAQQLADDPELDMVYSDEAVVADGRRVTQILKPGWSPESFACHMYACHLGVYRRSIAREIGGFRSEYDGCQDYDFVLRFTERTDRVAHIPAQLYHWRAHTASTAGGTEAKPYAYLLQPRAIAEHLDRVGVDAEVRFGGSPGLHRIAHRVAPGLMVSVALVADDLATVLPLARALGAQSHQSWELVIGLRESQQTAPAEILDRTGVGPSRITVVPIEGADAAHDLARVATEATGEQILLLDAVVHGLTYDWLEALMGYAAQPAIGAAGALVLDADGRVLDAGYAFPEGVALPLLSGLAGERASSITLNVSAVSGTVLTRRDVLRQLGGLDPSWGQLMVVEYCLRARSLGLRTVSVPDARVQRVEPGVIRNEIDALWRLRDAWVGQPRDPLYNPGFRSDFADFSPRERL